MHWLAAVLTFCVLAPAVLCAQETLVSYSVTLRAAMAVDAPEAIAGELAAGYDGTLAEPVRGSTFGMRLSASRARVLARDPRVESMVVQVTAVPTVEAMSWGTGVTYTYDGAGNVRKIGTDPFVYDAVSRLVQADTKGVRRNYEYDGFGNRTKCRQSEGTPTEGECQQAYTIDSGNNRVEGVTYDAAGNVTAFGGHTYTYDALSMQTRDTGAVVSREFLYTASDERIAVYTVGQSWRWTIRDTSGKVLREFVSYDGPNGPGTASWQWTKDYVWRDGLLLASRQMVGSSVTTYHNHLDHLGSPRRVTDASDRIVGVHDYIPFGPEASGGHQEPSLSLLKYTGHERDLLGAESWDTLDYMHARLYSPELGRFLSPDPGQDWDMGQPQSWNLYSYVRNNPINKVDPTGKWGFPWELLDLASYKQSSQASTDAMFKFANDPSLSNGVEFATKFTVAMADGAALLLPAIPAAGGHTQRLVREVTEEVSEGAARGSRNPKVAEAARKGQEAHKAEVYPAGFKKEVALPSGKRMDAYNKETKQVIELKPNNPRAIKKGEKQVKQYCKECDEVNGPGHTGTVRTYDPP